MRTWIILSSIIVLILAVPGMLLSLFTGDWGGAAVCALLTALAVHSFYYLRVARNEPERGYLQLATGQMLFGVIVAVLLLKMLLFINDPAARLLIQTSSQDMLQLIPLGLSQTEINWFLQDIDAMYVQAMPLFRAIVIAAAVLSLVSQGAFAWLLLRRRQPENTTASTPGSDNTRQS